MRPGSQVLRGALRHDRRALAASSLLVAGHQLAEAAVPVALGAALDSALGTADHRALIVASLAVVLVFVVLAACGWGGYWLALRQERGAAHELRVAVAARILHPAGGAPGLPAEQVALASGDAERAALVSRAVASGAGAAAALVGSAVVLLQASLLLGTVVLAGVPAVLLGARLLARPLAGRAAAAQTALATTTSMVTRLLTGLRPLKGIGAEVAAARAYRVASRHALAVRLEATRTTAGYEAVTGLLSALLLACVAFVGGDLALRGEVSVGELVAALGLAQFLVGPLERLVRVGTYAASARGSAMRLEPLLSAPAAVRSGALSPLAGLGGLRLQLPDGTAVDVAPGEHLGLVIRDAGVTAALLDVLARDCDDDGALLDGVDVRELDLHLVRQRLRVSRHDAALIEDTAGQAAGAEADVLAASRADEVLAALPAGPNTPLAGGSRLSGGQRQRLVLARALAGRPAVLVLHEPTSAIDAATEDAIADRLAQVRAGCTTVLLTASPALLSRCDRVLLLDASGVVAAGRHADLVTDAGYREVVIA